MDLLTPSLVLVVHTTLCTQVFKLSSLAYTLAFPYLWYPVKNILMSWTTNLTMGLATERFLAVCRFIKENISEIKVILILFRMQHIFWFIKHSSNVIVELCHKDILKLITKQFDDCHWQMTTLLGVSCIHEPDCKGILLPIILQATSLQES